MKRLPKSEWEPFAPDEPGVVRINHVSPSCSGTSKSLRITRTDDDRIYAKCYRCGGFGSSGGRLSSVPKVAKRLARHASTGGEPIKFPTDFSIRISDMPAIVRMKLHKWGIVQMDCDRWKMGWSDKLDRFIIPVWRDGEMIGYQARYYGDDTSQPKYITRYKDSPDLWVDINHTCHKKVVIVEDMFSAIRVSRFCPALALLGLEMSDSCLSHICNNYDSALVWTDYDSPAVRKKGIVIKERLTMVGVDGNVLIGKGITDPKNLTDSEIKDILRL